METSLDQSKNSDVQRYSKASKSGNQSITLHPDERLSAMQRKVTQNDIAYLQAALV